MSVPEDILVIEWVPVDSIQPNAYNPSVMAGSDRALLKRSILEHGWTQPIILRDGDNTIVDGEQRWSVARMPVTRREIESILGEITFTSQPPARLTMAVDTLMSREGRGLRSVVADLTGGKVPVTRLAADEVQARIATVRHNRARGTFDDQRMAEFLDDLGGLGLESSDLMMRLHITDEEMQRYGHDEALLAHAATAPVAHGPRPVAQGKGKKITFRLTPAQHALVVQVLKPPLEPALMQLIYQEASRLGLDWENEEETTARWR